MEKKHYTVCCIESEGVNPERVVGWVILPMTCNSSFNLSVLHSSSVTNNNDKKNLFFVEAPPFVTLPKIEENR